MHEENNNNPPVVTGRIDVRRLQKARAERAKQIEEWEQYDRRMLAEENEYSDSGARIVFPKNYVLLDAALHDDIKEGK